MYPNVGRDWTNQEWQARVAAYRQAVADNPATALKEHQELYQALLGLKSIVASYSRNVKDFDDVIHEAVIGREKRVGLLQALAEMPEAPAYPRAWAVMALSRWLIDALRRQRHTVDSDIDQTIDIRTSEGRTVPGVPDLEPSLTSVTVVPRQVAQSLREVVRFSAVAVELVRASPGTAASLGLGGISLKECTRATMNWSTLADCLSRDVDLGPGRLRWQHQGIDPTDNWARAWQNTFHLDQGNHGYFDGNEQPSQKTSPAGNLYYKHLERFRDAYAAATGRGHAVVDGAAKTGVGGADARTRRRQLPLAWEPAEHLTLVSNHKPNEGE